MKTLHSKYSFALSAHYEVGIKPQRYRRIPTSLHRRILTSHVFLYYVKRSLHKSRLIKTSRPAQLTKLEVKLST